MPAGPVFRARDTAEAAFGADRVRVTDELLADDYAGGRLEEVMAGHRTPLIMIAGPAVGGRALPEGAFAVVEPGGGFRVLGVLELAPLPGGGFHGC